MLTYDYCVGKLRRSRGSPVIVSRGDKYSFSFFADKDTGFINMAFNDKILASITPENLYIIRFQGRINEVKAQYVSSYTPARLQTPMDRKGRFLPAKIYSPDERRWTTFRRGAVVNDEGYIVSAALIEKQPQRTPELEAAIYGNDNEVIRRNSNEERSEEDSDFRPATPRAAWTGNWTVSNS